MNDATDDLLNKQQVADLAGITVNAVDSWHHRTRHAGKTPRFPEPVPQDTAFGWRKNHYRRSDVIRFLDESGMTFIGAPEVAERLAITTDEVAELIAAGVLPTPDRDGPGGPQWRYPRVLAAIVTDERLYAFDTGNLSLEQIAV